MVNLIIGQKGSGKTKRLVKLATEALENSKGNIIFIDDDKRCMSELNYKIRFINSVEYEIKQIDELYGFVAGLLAGNYDIQKIFIDGLNNITAVSITDSVPFIEKLNTLYTQHDVDTYITVNGSSDTLPAALQKYLFEELKIAE